MPASNHEPLVVYVGPFGFPNGGAAAQRILGNAKAIRDAGFEVIVCSGSPESNPENLSSVSGIAIHTINERTAENLPSILKHLAYVGMGRKTIEWLDDLPEKPVAVILYSGYSPYLIRLSAWSRRSGVKVIFDAVEWYQPPSFLHRFHPYFLNIELSMRYLVAKTGHIVAISSYLDTYFRKKGCDTILVPPLVDVGPTPEKTVARTGADFTLSYTGTPGNKDRLDNIIEAVLRIHMTGRRAVKLEIAGVTREQWTSTHRYSPQQLDALHACVLFHGRVPHERSLEIVRRSNFSIIARNVCRLSSAGFPTKFVESFLVGTPVISNLTSDLERYLETAKTGIIAASERTDDLVEAIEAAIEIPEGAHDDMRDRCRDRARTDFDFRAFSKTFRAFLDRD